MEFSFFFQWVPGVKLGKDVHTTVGLLQMALSCVPANKAIYYIPMERIAFVRT